MLLVVVGAGASNNFIPGRIDIDPELIPPLTDELVSNLPANRAVLASLPERAASGLVAELRRRIGSQSLEKVLDEIVSEDGDSTREMIAFRLYLQALLGRVSDKGVTAVGAVTNQTHLVRKIERWRRQHDSDNPVLYVTFNYDTILDQAIGSEHQWLKGRGGPALDDYIASPKFS